MTATGFERCSSELDIADTKMHGQKMGTTH